MGQPLPSISVVVPSFNQGCFIEATLLSLFGQQYPNLEIIVMDAGSSDNTVDILKRYESQIAYWQSKPDKGQADAINQGFRRSKGDVLFWLNSDDMLVPGTLLEIGKLMAGKIADCHLIYGSCFILDERSAQTKGFSDIAGEFDAKRLTYCDYIIQPSAFWTRKLWEATGELNVKYNYVLDWDWLLRALKHCSFQRVDRLFSIYRYHCGHKSSGGGEARRKELLAIVSEYAEPYWRQLFEKVIARYEILHRRRNFLTRWRVPKPLAIATLTCPVVFFSSRKMRDVGEVMRGL